MKNPMGKKRISIELERFHVEGLQHLAGLIPHASVDELLKIVISRGLVEMLTGALEGYRSSPTEIASKMNEAKAHMRALRSSKASHESKLTVRPQTIDPHRVPFGMKQTFQEQHAMEAEHDKEAAQFHRDMGLAEDVEPRTHRHVPQALSVRLSEEMRQALEDFLDAHPDLDEQDALSILVRRGLDHTEELEEVVQTAREQEATAMLELAERLCARSRRRCGW